MHGGVWPGEVQDAGLGLPLTQTLPPPLATASRTLIGWCLHCRAVPARGCCPDFSLASGKIFLCICRPACKIAPFLRSLCTVPAPFPKHFTPSLHCSSHPCPPSQTCQKMCATAKPSEKTGVPDIHQLLMTVVCHLYLCALHNFCTVPTLSLMFFAPFLHRSEPCYFASCCRHPAGGRARIQQHPAKWETCMWQHPANEMCTILTCATLVIFPVSQHTAPPSFCGEPMCRGCGIGRQPRLRWLS